MKTRVYAVNIDSEEQLRQRGLAAAARKISQSPGIFPRVRTN